MLQEANVYFETNIAADIYRDEVKRAERKSAEKYRFRDIKTPEAKALTAVLTSVLGLFIR